MARDPVQFSPKSIEDFRTMTILAALERAVDAQSKARELPSRCRSKRKRIVYRDCNNLIDNTILQLNITLQSIQTNASFTDFDAQTWLSTALTNIEICRSGSHDLNVTKFSSPILSGNVSELISNSLATNGALLDNSSNTYGGKSKKQGFPGWVTNRDRKLLQDLELATRANVVVSKDGRGHFRSIQAAINYATGRRVGNGRVVVYVKRGVYRENILISRTMNKVMLVGDGLRYTVITGSRSVSSGFTTYSSATVGKYRRHRIHSPRHHIPQHRRSTAWTGGGAPVRLRSLGLLRLWFRRLPRHSLRPRPTPILQIMLHLRHNRLHLR
ncbi:hypothetical protein DH2020_022409 [Rehmannia glutinosa]|uniref:Pectinesterase n=1 Tax=Rehmannia glutinosa TaxID=99300 RepID=A0ABR0WGX6_REHGL